MLTETEVKEMLASKEHQVGHAKWVVETSLSKSADYYLEKLIKLEIEISVLKRILQIEPENKEPKIKQS